MAGGHPLRSSAGYPIVSNAGLPVNTNGDDECPACCNNNSSGFCCTALWGSGWNCNTSSWGDPFNYYEGTRTGYIVVAAVNGSCAAISTIPQNQWITSDGSGGWIPTDGSNATENCDIFYLYVGNDNSEECPVPPVAPEVPPNPPSDTSNCCPIKGCPCAPECICCSQNSGGAGVWRCCYADSSTINFTITEVKNSDGRSWTWNGSAMQDPMNPCEWIANGTVTQNFGEGLTCIFNPVLSNIEISNGTGEALPTWGVTLTVDPGDCPDFDIGQLSLLIPNQTCNRFSVMGFDDGSSTYTGAGTVSGNGTCAGGDIGA